MSRSLATCFVIVANTTASLALAPCRCDFTVMCRHSAHIRASRLGAGSRSMDLSTVLVCRSALAIRLSKLMMPSTIWMRPRCDDLARPRVGADEGGVVDETRLCSVPQCQWHAPTQSGRLTTPAP
eukprot:4540301-Amphidinium_carterae.1